LRTDLRLPLFLCPALLFFLVVLPDNLLQFHPDVLLALPLELPLLGLLLLLSGANRPLLFAVASLLALRLILILADTLSHQVYARPFNPVFDAYLLSHAVYLLNGVLGPLAAYAIAGMAALLLVGIVWGVLMLLQKTRDALPARSWITLAFMLMLGLTWAVMRLTESPRAVQRVSNHLTQHLDNFRRSLVDIREFRAALPEKEMSASSPDLLERLRGKDVLFVFIESYGRTLLDKPEFAAHFRPFLAAQEKDLAQSGIGVRSAYLTSPTVGGLSWLAHATLMSGLWIDSQVRYDSLMMSRQPSLNRLFRDAGWRTVAVMPAITMAWPEAEYFGYDQIYHAYNSGYAGKPFNWVTMPDQYTLSAFHRSELAAEARSPVMAEIALISSHAPWTPVPTLVDWDAVGDGRIFDEQADSGDAPEVVWRDPQRIRHQYRLAVEYALATLTDYLVHHADDNLVVLAFGDHQPAPLVKGDNDNRDVPVHLLTRDPEILAAVADWQWRDGLVPADTGPVWPMSEVKEKLISAMSSIGGFHSESAGQGEQIQMTDGATTLSDVP